MFQDYFVSGLIERKRDVADERFVLRPAIENKFVVNIDAICSTVFAGCVYEEIVRARRLRKVVASPARGS